MLPNAQPKPDRGAYRLKQRQAKRSTATAERDVKREVKVRDRWRCRWPHATREHTAQCRVFRVEACHLTHKGMGGDPQALRTKRALLITFGLQCHQARKDSLDAKDRRVVFLTARKADGPCAFEGKRGGRWIEVGRELSVGVLA